MQSSLGIIPSTFNFPTCYRSVLTVKMLLARIRYADRMCPPSLRPLGTSDIRSEGVEMITIKKRIGSNRSRRATHISLAFLCLLLAVTLSAQAPKTESKSGIVRQLSEVRFPAGEGPDCLQFFLENGDVKTGPSTAIMKAKPKCVGRPSLHVSIFQKELKA